MANERQSGLDAIAGAARQEAKKGPPPVHLWNPPFCVDLDMRIATDGTWYYLKTPIGRPALVKLFASVLKREGDQYFVRVSSNQPWSGLAEEPLVREIFTQLVKTGL